MLDWMLDVELSVGCWIKWWMLDYVLDVRLIVGCVINFCLLDYVLYVGLSLGCWIKSWCLIKYKYLYLSFRAYHIERWFCIQLILQWIKFSLGVLHPRPSMMSIKYVYRIYALTDCLVAILFFSCNTNKFFINWKYITLNCISHC